MVITAFLMMVYYYIFAAIILVIQVFILIEAVRHVIYTRRSYRPKPLRWQPRVALIVPCRGSDTTFDRNISALFKLDYPDYELFFVVQDRQDPAYQRLRSIIEDFGQTNCPVRAHLSIAGPARASSQKVHNQMAVINALPETFTVWAFIDSDACPKPHFLTSLIRPLRRADVGASTGYRWFVPTDSRLSSITLSAVNAFFASILGPHKWNATWGGAMAIRREVFFGTGADKIMEGAPTDDYALTYAVKKAGLRVVFVPACFVASYEEMSWPQMFSFAQRQFIITRVCMPHLWWLGIASLGSFLLAFWGGLAVSLIRYFTGAGDGHLAVILPVALWFASIFKALGRQGLIRKVLPEDKGRLVRPALLDIFLQPLLAIFSLTALLAAGTTRKIVWRGISYILHDVGHTTVISTPTKESP